MKFFNLIFSSKNKLRISKKQTSAQTISPIENGQNRRKITHQKK